MKQEDTNRSTMNIQWYPGHMTKTRRMIEEDVKLVDAVCEILDARIPIASRNPDIDAICGNKPRMIVLNRIDMADPALTKKWAEHFRAKGYAVLQTDCKTKKGISGFVPAVRELLNNKDNFEDVDEELTPTEAKFLGGTAEKYEGMRVRVALLACLFAALASPIP